MHLEIEVKRIVQNKVVESRVSIPIPISVSSNQEERRAQGIHLLLEYQGYKTSALDSIAVALSPLAVKSLSDEERGDVLVKRDELKVEVSLLEKSGGGGLLDQAVVETVKLQPDNARAWCLLGICYEAKEMMEKAKEAYEAALKAHPDYKPATEALEAQSRKA